MLILCQKQLVCEMGKVRFVLNFMRNALTLLICIFSITQIWTQTLQSGNDVLLMREMRGLWVASVNNIDWPSAPNLPVDSLKKEAISIIDRAKKMGLNTIFLQVRPSSDVIYHSDIEPLTYYLVGEVDGLPSDFDALAYWITETHKRGLELHAWINPLRATPKPDYQCGASHISRKHPDWLVKYADKQYLNPGLPQVRHYVVSIVDEIVKKYNIDGIHFDDYFYPYPVQGEVFHDEATYNQYNPLQLTLADWRRSNVDSLISGVSAVVRAEKDWLRFGISPFGVWRNKSDDERGSETRAGTTDYDVLYADVLHWAQMHWIDYVVPQIYWEIGHKVVDFDILHKWWADAFAQTGTQVYVGHAVYKINDSTMPWKNSNEMPMQIEKVRQHNGLLGSVFFSYRQFNRDILGLEERMHTNLYVQKSLLPEQSKQQHLNTILIDEIDCTDGNLIWHVNIPDSIRFYVIYEHPKGKPQLEHVVDIVGETSYKLPRREHRRSKHVIRIAPIDFYGHEYEKSDRYIVKY